MHINSLKILPCLVICAYVIAATSCSDTCNENRNALPLAGFYASGNNAEKIEVDSVEVYGPGAPGDSILSPASTSKEEIYLPFAIDSDTTQYVFAARDNGFVTRDTVTFVYTRVPRFVNVECGASYLFNIREISNTGALIDSVVCPDGYIDNTNAENLRIYFAVSTSSEPEP